jgi:class 3 adenylate cyclase/tetratricopeptide (TPR) repeat protein
MTPNEDPVGGRRPPPPGSPAETSQVVSRPGSIALPSERKVVTVLFADTVESTRLIEALDPEEASHRLGPLIQAMVSGIHQYGGTVIRSEGDAIVALFGAPHAYEDHAVRACQSAIAVLRRVVELNDDELKIRVALHSGEVMVRPVVRDVSVEYEVTGMPMHVASRVEKLTKASTICATRATAQLVEGLVGVTWLGRFELRGLSEAVDLFEVTSPLTATSLDARLARGLTPFVGRVFEKNVLWNAAESARMGRGQLIELIGDAGVGKSRLVYELASTPIMADYRILAGSSASYAQDQPYFSFRHLFRKVFGIESQDDDRAAAGKLAARLSADSRLANLIPAFHGMLGLPAGDLAWLQLDPIERRRQIMAAARDFVFSLAESAPVLCILEDLHWMDDESQAVLEHIVGEIDRARVLVCVTSRTGFPSLGGHVGYYTRLPVQPLDPSDSLNVLDHLLEGQGDLHQIRSLIVSKAQGNPLFLEELTRMLSSSMEAGAAGKSMALSPQLDLQVPSTVQSVIAARIDGLSALEKRVLQVASVVGGDVPTHVLERVSGLDRTTLEQTLGSLSAAKYLFNSKSPPDSEFSFYHALTQEVAYLSLLKERRRTLHGAICHVFAELYAGRSEQVAELLAYHAELGELWDKAVSHLRQAAANAIERSAYKEAINFLERALQALSRLSASKSRAETSIELRLRLRIALGAMGEYNRLFEHLSLAEQDAILIGDRPRLTAVCIAKVHVLNMVGNIEEAITNGLRACELAAGNRDPAQSLMANYFLAQAHEFRGDYGAVIALLTQDAPDLLGAHRHTRFGMTGTNAVLHLSLLSHSHAYLGAFAEAESCARDALAVASETGRPYDAGIAHFGDGIVKLCQGHVAQAIASLEEGWRICKTRGISALPPMIGCRLGFAYAINGETEKAAELLELSLQGSRGVVHVHCWSLTFSAWCEYRRGAGTLALARQHEALQLARQHGYRGIEVWSLWLLGIMLSGSDRYAEAKISLEDAAALARTLEMRLHVGYCYSALTTVYDRLGELERSVEANAVVVAQFADGDGLMGRLNPLP